jgi:roadblock/LC7 domain-containing protein
MTDDHELDEELEAACRTAVGDRLRAIVYFTAGDHRLVYLRDDIQNTESLDTFLANERLGLTAQEAYDDPELGDYQSTIRTFQKGYLTRVISGDHGVFVTTDEMEIERFRDLAEAARSILKELA